MAEIEAGIRKAILYVIEIVFVSVYYLSVLVGLTIPALSETKAEGGETVNVNPTATYSLRAQQHG